LHFWIFIFGIFIFARGCECWLSWQLGALLAVVATCLIQNKFKMLYALRFDN
jgi:hypothetical protein